MQASQAIEACSTPSAPTPSSSTYKNNDSRARSVAASSRHGEVERGIRRARSPFDDADVQMAHVELSAEEGMELRSDEEDDWVRASDGKVVPGRRLWDTRALNPSGVSKWDNAANCAAALKYDCPCGEKCLSKVADVIELYNHRKKFRSRLGTHGRSGALRDTLRDMLAQHYDAQLGAFSNSFVVAGIGGMCERAYVVACGVGEATFVRARADVTKDRPTHVGRVRIRTRKVTNARCQLDAWVRAQRNSMEGDKSTGLKWYTEKVTERQLWLRYVRSCDHAQVSSTCTSGVFVCVWSTIERMPAASTL